MVDTLRIIELTFSAAHYLPNHPKCGCIHGHTYFVRNLLVDCDKFVDLGDIKKTIASFDHTFIVPAEHLTRWIELLIRAGDGPGLGISPNFETTEGPPTVENIHREIKKRLMLIQGILRVRFELYEGPNQGVVPGV